jgi:putative acetyltransferase
MRSLCYLSNQMSRIELVRTSYLNPDFISLVEMLNIYLAEVDGEDHSFYSQYNGIENIQNVVVAYKDSAPAGCGAIKPYSSDSAEIKRMFVKPAMRGLGIAAAILMELENWAAELGYTSCILKTGKKQTEAIGLYRKAGYEVISNYGQYAGIENSICMEKKL